MCGIYARFFKSNNKQQERSPPLHSHLKVRGPDEFHEVSNDTLDYTLAFYRLAIVDVANGHQPFVSGDIDLLCNGEIYNHKKLIDEFKLPCETKSDCEVIMHLYARFGIEKTVSLLDGEFAFILIDKKAGMVHFARDWVGVKPLYLVADIDDKYRITYFELSSMIKCLNRDLAKVHCKPSTIYSVDLNNGIMTLQEYAMLKYVPVCSCTEVQIMNAFVNAVHKRIVQSERPIGFMLSGGFDSSLVLSVALESGLLKSTPHVFTFGFDENAPDVKSAQLMVNWLKEKYGNECIVWHKVIQPISDGISAMPLVIWHLETYDTTTVRASVPMFLLSKYIREKTDVKVILSGEGSDELFGGYLYFKYAPNDTSFRNEIISLCNHLYFYDVLRADRTTAANGLELRPPFLDRELVDTVLKCRDLKRSKDYTKELIRRAAVGYLPDEILWGKKEAFSDAVGLSWVETIKKHADSVMTIDGDKEPSQAKLMMEKVSEMFDHHMQDEVTNEMLCYRMLFMSLECYNSEILPRLWLPNQSWVQTGVEPSARVLSVYKQN